MIGITFICGSVVIYCAAWVWDARRKEARLIASRELHSRTKGYQRRYIRDARYAKWVAIVFAAIWVIAAVCALVFIVLL